jgi:hypothetical protein
MAFPRYVEDSIELTRLARQRGMKVLALTDKPASPLVPLADVVLYAHTQRQVAPTSNATVLALLEALVAAVARRTEGAVERQRELTRSVMPWLHLEVAPRRRPPARRPRRPGRGPRSNPPPPRASRPPEGLHPPMTWSASSSTSAPTGPRGPVIALHGGAGTLTRTPSRPSSRCATAAP